MRVLVLHHVPQRPIVVQSWVDKNNHQLSAIFTPECMIYPEPDEYDLFIIMGGPMSVNDPLLWIGRELDFIHRLLKAAKPVLGICLGAQLMAKALGAKVFGLGQREIGWFDVNQVEHPVRETHWLMDCLPRSFSPFHWHGDSFEMPDGAVHLYQSEGCDNQAFAINENIVGLQFHLDFRLCTAERVANESAEQLLEGGDYVQSLSEILSEPERFEEANEFLFRVLDGFSECVRKDSQSNLGAAAR